ncbi:MAG: hypothetical protein AB8B55_16735, partial [Mariniblastus sp.]
KPLLQWPLLTRERLAAFTRELTETYGSVCISHRMLATMMLETKTFNWVIRLCDSNALLFQL